MEEFKYSMAGWDTVCSPIELGSLGIKQIGHSLIKLYLGNGYYILGMKILNLWR